MRKLALPCLGIGWYFKGLLLKITAVSQDNRVQMAEKLSNHWTNLDCMCSQSKSLGSDMGAWLAGKKPLGKVCKTLVAVARCGHGWVARRVLQPIAAAMDKKSNAADRHLAYRHHAPGVLQTFLKPSPPPARAELRRTSARSPRCLRAVPLRLCPAPRLGCCAPTA